MARDFTIPYDWSRISGSVAIDYSYVPTLESAGITYLGTHSENAVVYLPNIFVSTFFIAQIPVIQQVPCVASFKNTYYPYVTKVG
jgi:hypothetical protein